MSEPKTRWVNLSRIPPEKRQEAWERLQRDYPDQAAYLQDPLVVLMKETFQAEISIELPIKDK